MKSIISIILVCLLIWSSSGQRQPPRGVELVGPLTKTAFACLTIPSYQRIFVIIRAYKISGTRGLEPSAVETFDNAKNSGAGYFINAYVEVCRSADPSEPAIALGLAYPSPVDPPFDVIFVKVVPNTVAGCTWTGYTRQQNCDYLTAVMAALSSAFIGRAQLGIHSTATTWNSFFGTTCNNFTNTFLWYANYNSTGQINTNPSSSDFVSFGGWAYPTIKSFSNGVNMTLCNNPAWHAYFNEAAFRF